MTDSHERVVTVASVAEALSHLATQRGQARIVAGLAGLSQRMSLPEDAYLVDVSEVAALRRVEEGTESVSLGSAVRLGAPAQHVKLGKLVPLLTVAAQHHVAQGLSDETLGARIVSSRGGDPLNVALVALGAQAEITNLTGPQWLPVESLFVREGVSRVD
ncbi:MAG: FAD binding domain-containing protein, partial [Anaerolineae bacterium]